MLEDIEDVLPAQMLARLSSLSAEGRTAVADWLRSEQEEFLDYPDDCERISDILYEGMHFITHLEAQVIWRRYSSKSSENWRYLPHDDDDLYDVLVGELYEIR